MAGPLQEATAILSTPKQPSSDRIGPDWILAKVPTYTPSTSVSQQLHLVQQSPPQTSENSLTSKTLAIIGANATSLTQS